MNDTHDERFQELAEEVFETIRLLEVEIVCHRYALQQLRTSFFGQDAAAASFFQSSLEVAHQSSKIRREVGDTKRARLAPFQQMPHMPLGPKIDALCAFLKDFRDRNQG